MGRFDKQGPEPMTVDPQASDREPESPPGVDTTRPHSARIWNYWLDGKDNYPADRQVGDEVAAMLPSIVTQAREDRRFLARAVRFLAGECRVRQFLDVGSGLPTCDNTHEVAQSVDATAKVLYVDNDPLVLVHAHTLLTSSPEGFCDYIEADLQEPKRIVGEAHRVFDFNQPIALMMLGVLHHIVDDAEAYGVTENLVGALPGGSFLVVNHASNSVFGAESDAAAAHWNQFGKPKLKLRSPERIEQFFTGSGLKLVEPGIITCSRWRPDPSQGLPEAVDEFSGVAVKP